MRPVRLESNRPKTFYRGSGAIASFRGEPARSAETQYPEDWVASTTALFGRDPLGKSVLPDGRLLATAIQADPLAWLGLEHVEKYGADPKLLVKLLDAGQRLPVHVHPDRAFARRHLDSSAGKTEAWIVIDAPPGAAVHLGFRRDVDPAELDSWCRSQDVERLLGETNRIPVVAGDTLLVPAGLPHVIGEGVLLVELQEPTDFSVLLEWRGFDVASPLDGQLGLPFEVGLRCVDPAAVGEDRLRTLAATRGSRLFPDEADPFFRADRIVVSDGKPATLEPGYGVLVGLAGAGLIEWQGLVSSPVGGGDTVLIPFGAGRIEISGEFTGILARPPA